jgi:Ni,Fe-hydrogenase III small subunit/ferredoxin
MFKALLARKQQGCRTIGYPDSAPVLPERFRGRPLVDANLCASQCHSCVEACPTGAIALSGNQLEFDLGRCLFCLDCSEACPKGAIHHSKDHSMATRRRLDLVVRNGMTQALAMALDAQSQKVFGHSLKLRQVSAGGCNACEADVNVLGTVVFDLGRFGIQFVASPRHADGILVTGPVTANMRLALQKTFEAIPSPKFVIAVGACAISGGPFVDHKEVNNGAENVIPVDLFIPGCPPHPITILDGLLRLLGRLPEPAHAVSSEKAALT